MTGKILSLQFFFVAFNLILWDEENVFFLQYMHMCYHATFPVRFCVSEVFIGETGIRIFKDFRNFFRAWYIFVQLV